MHPLKIKYLIAFVFAALILMPGIRGLSIANDLDIFLAAAESLKNGESMYAGPYMNGLWYYYSPLFAACLIPFTWMPVMGAKILWLALNLLFLFFSIKFIFRQIPIQKSTCTNWTCAFLAIASVRVVHSNLLNAQMSLLLLFCCLFAFEYSRTRIFRAALALAAGINIKIMPLLVLGHFFFKKEYRFIAVTSGLVVVTVLLPFLFLPTGYHASLLTGWWEMINPINDEHILQIGEGGFLDIGSMIVKYFTDAHIPTESNLNIASLNYDELFWATQGARVFIMGMAAFFTFKLKHSVAGIQPGFLSFCYWMAIIPLVFPHQRDYSFLLALPLIATCIHTLFDRNFTAPKITTALFILSLLLMGCLVNFTLFSKALKSAYEAQRIMGMGGLLLLFSAPALLLSMQGAEKE